MSRVTVELSWDQAFQAAIVGVIRQLGNLFKGRKDRYGCSLEDGWGEHIRGAIAEYAVSKWLGIFWCGNINRLRAADAGKIQVRSAVNHNKRLILHKEDNDNDIFVFVTGNPQLLQLRGWIYADEGKIQKYWTDPQRSGRTAYFVDTDILRPMKGLEVSHEGE